MDKITFTLAKIREHSPCKDGWIKLYTSLGGIKSYGKHTPITATQLIDAIGINDALWCLRTLDRKYDNLWRHLACDYTERVKHKMTDESSLNALVVARKHADGKATDEEFSTESSAASNDACDAARIVAWGAACDDASEAARIVACDDACDDASEAARRAASNSVWCVWEEQLANIDAEHKYQAELLIEYCETGKRVLK